MKETVQRAKTYVIDFFSNEGLLNLGLDKVVFDESKDNWIVTLDLSRPRDHPPGPLAVMARLPVE